jgi:hypothetical protein
LVFMARRCAAVLILTNSNLLVRLWGTSSQSSVSMRGTGIQYTWGFLYDTTPVLHFISQQLDTMATLSTRLERTPARSVDMAPFAHPACRNLANLFEYMHPSFTLMSTTSVLE